MLAPQARPVRRSQRLRSTLLLAGAVVAGSCLTVGLVVPASAAVVAPASLGSATAETPTPEQLAEAQRQAERSAAQATRAQSDLDAAQVQLDALATQAGAALETFQQAKEAQWAAEQEELAQRDRLAQAEAVLAEGKKDLGSGPRRPTAVAVGWRSTPAW